MRDIRSRALAVIVVLGILVGSIALAGAKSARDLTGGPRSANAAHKQYCPPKKPHQHHKHFVRVHHHHFHSHNGYRNVVNRLRSGGGDDDDDDDRPRPPKSCPVEHHHHFVNRHFHHHHHVYKSDRDDD